MRPLLPALAVLALMAAPLAAQTDTPFGVQIVRGPATEPPVVASDAWIDPSGFSTPVMITRGGVRIAAPRPVVAPRAYGLRADRHPRGRQAADLPPPGRLVGLDPRVPPLLRRSGLVASDPSNSARMPRVRSLPGPRV